MKKGVIYTAIFGGKDNLQEPEYIPEGFDFICFTDNKNISSKSWQIKLIDPPFTDPVRCARHYKILAHRFLPEYEYSVWVDGNMVVIGDLNELVNQSLEKVSLALYNHANLKRRVWGLFWMRDRSFARNCIYKEAKELLRKTAGGHYMDDPNLIEEQIKRYKEEGYPENNGLAVTMVLLRRHNEEKVKKTMESWWQELVNGSRRDQLSFNYVIWKDSLPFKYINGDPRYNKYFSKVRHAQKENYKG